MGLADTDYEVLANGDAAIIEGAFTNTWINGTGPDAFITSFFNEDNYTVKLRLSDNSLTDAVEVTGVILSSQLDVDYTEIDGTTANYGLTDAYYYPIEFSDFSIPSNLGVIGAQITLNTVFGQADIGKFVITTNAINTTMCDGIDTDGDGTPNHLDLDSDDDGCPDSMEAGFTDTDYDEIIDYTGIDADGKITGSDGYSIPLDTDSSGIFDFLEDTVTNYCDFDGDGVPNSIDIDDDNDGIADSAEGFSSMLDTDGDGIPNAYDLDSDGDGCYDSLESYLNRTNGLSIELLNPNGSIISDGASNGMVKIGDTYFYTSSQSEERNNGVSSRCEDSDGDGVIDALDLDVDNDGILNTDEGFEDLDSDGIANLFDLDSDGDGCNDVKEAGFTDADEDGVLDGTGFDADGKVTGGADGYTTPTDGDTSGTEDFKEILTTLACFADFDGDGIDNATDLDDDNDGILDTDEGTGDADGDGIPNLYDLDSDNDGCLDTTEAGFTDANEDGILDGTGIDADGKVTGGTDGYTTPLDSNTDSVLDFLDAYIFYCL